MKPIINDYVFYKIVNDDLPEYIYIGSTVHFIKRKCDHKAICNNPNIKNHNLKLYKTIRENGGWEKWNMIVIDEVKQVTLTEARIKEEELRLKYDGNLNMVKAHRGVEELKEYSKEISKEYYNNNKEAILEREKKYRESHKESIAEYKKEYCEKNKEAIAEKNKEYYQKNKEFINKKNSEKITCECGAVLVKHGKNRHINTLKHQQFCQPIDLSIT
tara:strand:+ start:242 stop:889 length:648 start_codon:yes stop_codon:yes gene_type:complete